MLNKNDMIIPKENDSRISFKVVDMWPNKLPFIMVPTSKKSANEIKEKIKNAMVDTIVVTTSASAINEEKDKEVKEELEKFMNSLDSEKNGKINFEEFSNFMKTLLEK